MPAQKVIQEAIEMWIMLGSDIDAESLSEFIFKRLLAYGYSLERGSCTLF